MRAAKYPPLGERSAGGPLPHLHYRSFPAAEADAALNAATTLMVQFESEEAVAKADEIAAVDGVDMVMIGSNDFLAGLRACRPIRPCAAARRLCQNHRRLPQARQTCRRRRPGVATRACRRIRAHGRPLCFDRHRSRLSAWRRYRQGEGSAGHQCWMERTDRFVIPGRGRRPRARNPYSLTCDYGFPTCRCCGNPAGRAGRIDIRTPFKENLRNDARGQAARNGPDNPRLFADARRIYRHLPPLTIIRRGRSG